MLGRNKTRTEEAKSAQAEPAAETAVVNQASPGVLAHPMEPLLGFENFDESDLIIPRLSIVQPTSKEGTPGTFRSNLSGEEKEELRITPITFTKGMVLWSDELGNDPECRSNDALVPDPAIETPRNDRCHERTANRLRPVCPYAMWRAGEAPACKMTYTLLAIDMATMLPFLTSLHGTSVRSMKALISHVWQSRRPFFDVACRMGLNKVTNQRGTFFVADFSQYEDHEPGTFREAYESLRAYDVQRTFDAEQQAEADGEKAPAPDKF